MSVKLKNRILLSILGVFFGIMFIGLLMNVFQEKPQPISAEGWSIEERTKHDEKVVFEKLSKEFNTIEKVQVDHEYNSIKVKTSIEKGSQYSKDEGKQIEKAVEKILDENVDKLTIEEKFMVMVFSKESTVL